MSKAAAERDRGASASGETPAPHTDYDVYSIKYSLIILDWIISYSSQVTDLDTSDLIMSIIRAPIRTQTFIHPAFRTSPRSLPLFPQHRSASGTSDWSGRQPQEHVSNRKDELDVQSGASQSGKRERVTGGQEASQGTSEKDSGNQNQQAQKDHPEAPGPVIGMNDERGQVSLRIQSDKE